MAGTNEEMITTDEFEERYKMDKQTQKICREKYGLPYIKPGKRIFYRNTDVEAWIEKQIKINGDDAEEHH